LFASPVAVSSDSFDVIMRNPSFTTYPRPSGSRALLRWSPRGEGVRRERPSDRGCHRLLCLLQADGIKTPHIGGAENCRPLFFIVGFVFERFIAHPFGGDHDGRVLDLKGQAERLERGLELSSQ
jgi:hypothetical protein